MTNTIDSHHAFLLAMLIGVILSGILSAGLLAVETGGINNKFQCRLTASVQACAEVQ